MALPLVPIVVATGVGYLTLREQKKADEKKVAPEGAPAAIGTHGNRLAIHSLPTQDGSFVLGGKPSAIQVATPVDAGKVLAGIGSGLAVGVTVVTVIGGGSLATGLGTISAALASFVPIGTIVVFIIFIVAAIVAIIFFGVSSIDEDNRQLQYGRAGYLDDLKKLFVSVNDAMHASLENGLDGKKLSAADQKHIDKYIRCFSFAVVRGYNRAMMAWVTSEIWGTYMDGRYAGQSLKQATHTAVEHYAARGACQWEEGWITDLDASTKGIQIYLGQWEEVPGGTVESNFFTEGSYAQCVAELRAAKFWKTSVEKENQEDSADFLGRAMAVKKAEPRLNIFNPFEGAKIAVLRGMIGRKAGIPNEDIAVNSTVGWVKSGAAYVSIDMNSGTVSDVDGNSGLKWYFDETQSTGTVVVR